MDSGLYCVLCYCLCIDDYKCVTLRLHWEVVMKYLIKDYEHYKRYHYRILKRGYIYPADSMKYNAWLKVNGMLIMQENLILSEARRCSDVQNIQTV